LIVRRVGHGNLVRASFRDQLLEKSPPQASPSVFEIPTFEFRHRGDILDSLHKPQTVFGR
jgi:hypothetical protein